MYAAFHKLSLNQNYNPCLHQNYDNLDSHFDRNYDPGLHQSHNPYLHRNPTLQNYASMSQSYDSHSQNYDSLRSQSYEHMCLDQTCMPQKLDHRKDAHPKRKSNFSIKRYKSKTHAQDSDATWRMQKDTLGPHVKFYDPQTTYKSHSSDSNALDVHVQRDSSSSPHQEPHFREHQTESYYRKNVPENYTYESCSCEEDDLDSHERHFYNGAYDSYDEEYDPHLHNTHGNSLRDQDVWLNHKARDHKAYVHSAQTCECCKNTCSHYVSSRSFEKPSDRSLKSYDKCYARKTYYDGTEPYNPYDPIPYSYASYDPRTRTFNLRRKYDPHAQNIGWDYNPGHFRHERKESRYHTYSPRRKHDPEHQRVKQSRYHTYSPRHYRYDFQDGHCGQEHYLHESNYDCDSRSDSWISHSRKPFRSKTP